MDLKIAARMTAVFAIGAGLTAAIMALHNDEDRNDASVPRIARPGGDPDPRHELARCRDMGAAALDDVKCRSAWADSRRRFLHIDKPYRPAAPKPERFDDRPASSGNAAGEPETRKEQERLEPQSAGDTEEVPL